MNTPNAALPKLYASGPDKALTLALRLAHAEQALETHGSSQIDAIVNAQGGIYLLRPAQEHLRQSEAQLQAILDSVAAAIAVLDEKGEVCYQGFAVTRLLGHKSEALVGHSFFEFVHPDDFFAFDKAFSEVVEKARPVAIVEFRYQTQIGSWRRIEAVISPLRQSTEATRVVLTCNDVTRRRHAEEETIKHEANPMLDDLSDAKIDQSEKVLEEFAQFLSDQRSVILEEWLASVTNDARLPVTDGLTREQLRDHLPRILGDLSEVLRSSEDGFQNHTERARLHGRERFGQNFHLSEVVWEISVVRLLVIAQILNFEEQTPTFRGKVKRVAIQCLHGFFDNLVADAATQFTKDQQGELRSDLAQARHDINLERSEREDFRIASHSETEKLRAVDSARLRLLRTVTHELRNSVNGAQLTVQSLEEETDPEAREESTAILQRAVQHMAALLNDLLNYSLILNTSTAPALEKVSIPELYKDIVGMFAPLAAAKGLHLESEGDPNLTVVMTNRMKMIQIASNLLSNAIKYTPNGSVGFFLKGVDESRWSLTVKDTGQGIPPEERGRIFEEFHRVKNTSGAEGTGLGLALVKRLTDLFNGEIRVESEVGKGTQFEVILPRNTADEIPERD